MHETTHTRVDILKVTRPDKRIVVGWAYKSAHADGSPYVDVSGEHIPYDELESMVPPFMAGQADTSGVMHEDRGVARIIGWFPIDSRDREALGFGVGDSGVLVKMRVLNDDVWKRVQSGELPALSVEGTALREEVAA